MKTIINLLAGIIFLINTSFANEINYKLNLTNITFTSEKTLEFDIYLMSAGETKEEFRYAIGQYFLDINEKFANSGTLTYSIVKSELPESMKPGSVSVSDNQLRLSVNQINSDSKSFPVHLKDCIRQLDEYFKGKRMTFDLPLIISGTDFQKKVWNELKKIPFGKTASYKDIALKAGNVKAVRAAGNANNKNKIAVIIPCHRVIGSDGKLSGYAGGVKRKKWLLEHERNFLINN